MKKQHRKPARRTPKPKPKLPKLDAELIELADVLAERRHAHNMAGWFEIPWRDGINAAQLAISTAAVTVSATSVDVQAALTVAMKTAVEMLRGQRLLAEAYHQSAELLSRLTRQTKAERGARAALRCLQLRISNSDGGGRGYNDVLLSSLEAEDLDEDAVLYARCCDAIGTSPQLNNDRHDRKRRAFSIAWKRGLFHAAYAIGPITGKP